MFKTLAYLVTMVVLVAAHDIEQTGTGIAHLKGTFRGKHVKGDLTFTMQDKDSMLINGTITGMPPGHYGLNVHESGDITDGCNSALGHFNPHGHDHGHPDDHHRHAGILGNVEFSSGVAQVRIVNRLTKLRGPQGIIGRAVALASMKDDYGQTDHPRSKIDGNAGDLVACGVIGIK